MYAHVEIKYLPYFEVSKLITFESIRENSPRSDKNVRSRLLYTRSRSSQAPNITAEVRNHHKLVDVISFLVPSKVEYFKAG